MRIKCITLKNILVFRLILGMVFVKINPMKKIIYILVFVLLFLNVGFAFCPSPVNVNSYSLDGYPELLKISAPIPNPVVDFAEVWYNIPEDQMAEICVYNFTGVRLKSIPVSGGLGRINLEAYDLQSGVYFVCLIYQGKNVDSKKMVKK